MLQRASFLLSDTFSRAWAGKSRKSCLEAPIATITFDGCPRSAFTSGGTILQNAGIRGTYFISGCLAGREVDGVRYFDADDLVKAYEHGHEIGSRTFDNVSLSPLSEQQIDATLAANSEFVSGLLGDVAMTSFAYPFGDVQNRTRRLIGQRFASGRGARPGINRATVDLSLLQSVTIDQRLFSAGSLQSLIDRTAGGCGWIIFSTQDFDEASSGRGCTPRLLAIVVDALLDAGVEILPMKAAVGRVAWAVPQSEIGPNS